MIWIRGRKNWGAKPPTTTPTYQDPRAVHTLVVHHTAGHAPSTIIAARDEMQHIQNLHRGNGWIDIGYNVVIDRQGRIWEGRGLSCVGAHTQHCNTGTFGVSFMGNYQHIRINKRQRLAFAGLKLKLRARGYRFDHIVGHNQMPDQATACPASLKQDLKLGW